MPLRNKPIGGDGKPATPQELLDELQYCVNHGLYFDIAPEDAKVMLQTLTFAVTYSASLIAATAHRACCGEEHSPTTGKIHGYCVVCGVPWPCSTAKFFLRSTEECSECDKTTLPGNTEIWVATK